METPLLKQYRKILIPLLITSGTAVCLVIWRIAATSSLMYLFLVWNLFLAWIPLGAALTITKLYHTFKTRLVLLPVFFVWLLFFPNSPYIITDLFHIRASAGYMLWYDVMLVFFFAWTGMMLGFISLLEIHKMLNRFFSKPLSWMVVVVLLFLCGYGIYLGRFERWNSWDILTHPFALFQDLIKPMLSPFEHKKIFGATLMFGMILLLSYVTLSSLIKTDEHEH